jgi:transcriptional regulator with XRE-family HTH domain
MKINTSQVEMVLLNKAIPAHFLEKEIGINRSAVTRIRNGERKIGNLTLATVIKIQNWIDAGNYHFSYDYSDLIKELESDIAEGLTDEYIYIVRGAYNEILEKCPIIDYYYTAEDIEEGDFAEKALTASVLEEMRRCNEAM